MQNLDQYLFVVNIFENINIAISQVLFPNISDIFQSISEYFHIIYKIDISISQVLLSGTLSEAAQAFNCLLVLAG